MQLFTNNPNSKLATVHKSYSSLMEFWAPLSRWAFPTKTLCRPSGSSIRCQW